MGAVLGSLITPAVPLQKLALPWGMKPLEYSPINKGRFFKSLVCESGGVRRDPHRFVLKIFQKPRDMPLRGVRQYLVISAHYRSILSAHAPHSLPYTAEFDGPDAVYVCRPYLYGSLQELAGGVPWMTEGYLLGISLRMIQAVAEVHGAGLVHGDLKLSNFLYTEAYDVFLTDFAPWKPGEVSLRDPAYISYFFNEAIAPERVVDREVDAITICTQEADVFSLGCALVELWTGEKAFDLPLLYAFKNDPMAVYHEIKKKLDFIPCASLRELVRRMISVAPEMRLRLATLQLSSAFSATSLRSLRLMDISLYCSTLNPDSDAAVIAQTSSVVFKEVIRDVDSFPLISASVSSGSFVADDSGPGAASGSAHRRAESTSSVVSSVASSAVSSVLTPGEPQHGALGDDAFHTPVATGVSSVAGAMDVSQEPQEPAPGVSCYFCQLERYMQATAQRERGDQKLSALSRSRSMASALNAVGQSTPAFGSLFPGVSISRAIPAASSAAGGLQRDDSAREELSLRSERGGDTFYDRESHVLCADSFPFLFPEAEDFARLLSGLRGPLEPHVCPVPAHQELLRAQLDKCKGLRPGRAAQADLEVSQISWDCRVVAPYRSFLVDSGIEAYFMHCILRLSHLLLEDRLRLELSTAKAVSTLCFLSQFVNDVFIERVCIPTVYTMLAHRQVAEAVPGMLFLLNLLSSPSEAVYYYPLLCIAELLLDQASLDIFLGQFFPKMRDFIAACSAGQARSQQSPAPNSSIHGPVPPSSGPGPVGHLADSSAIILALRATMDSARTVAVNTSYRFQPLLCARYLQYFVATMARFSRGSPVIQAVVKHLFTDTSKNVVYSIFERKCFALQNAFLSSADLLLRLIPEFSQQLLWKVSDCAPTRVGTLLGFNIRHFRSVLTEPGFFSRMFYDNLCNFIATLASADGLSPLMDGPASVDDDDSAAVAILRNPLTTSSQQKLPVLSPAALDEELAAALSTREIPEKLFIIADACLTMIQRVAFIFSAFLNREMVWAAPTYPIAILSRFLASLILHLPKALVPEFVTYLNNTITCKFYESLRYYVLLLLFDVSQDFRDNVDPVWFQDKGAFLDYQGGHGSVDSLASSRLTAVFSLPPHFRDFTDTRQIAMRQMILNLVCEALHECGMLGGMNFGSSVAGREDFDLRWLEENAEPGAKGEPAQFTIALFSADILDSGAEALVSEILSARARLCSAMCAVLDRIYAPIKANGGIAFSSHLLERLGIPPAEQVDAIPSPAAAMLLRLGSRGPGGPEDAAPDGSLERTRSVESLRDVADEAGAATALVAAGSARAVSGAGDAGNAGSCHHGDSSVRSLSPSGAGSEGPGSARKQARQGVKPLRRTNLLRQRRNTSTSLQLGGAASQDQWPKTARAALGASSRHNASLQQELAGSARPARRESPLLTGIEEGRTVVFDPSALGFPRMVLGVPTSMELSAPGSLVSRARLKSLLRPRRDIMRSDALGALFWRERGPGEEGSPRLVSQVGAGPALAVLWGLAAPSGDVDGAAWRSVAPNLTGEFLDAVLNYVQDSAVTIAPQPGSDPLPSQNVAGDTLSPIESYVRKFSRTLSVGVPVLLRSLPCFAEVLARVYNNVAPSSDSSPIQPVTLVYPNVHALSDAAVLSKLVATVSTLSSYIEISQQAVGDILLGSATLSGVQSNNRMYSCVSNAKLATSRAIMRRSVKYHVLKLNGPQGDNPIISAPRISSSSAPSTPAAPAHFSSSAELSLAASLILPVSRRQDGSTAEVVAISFDRRTNLVAVADSNGFVTIYANPVEDTTSYVCRKLIDVATVDTEVVYSSSVNFALSELFRANFRPKSSFFGPLLPRDLKSREGHTGATPSQPHTSLSVTPGLASSLSAITPEIIAGLIAMAPLSRPMARFRTPGSVTGLRFENSALTIVGPSGITLLHVDEFSLSLRFMLALVDELRYGKARPADDCLFLELKGSCIRVCNRTPVGGAYAAAAGHVTDAVSQPGAQTSLLLDLASAMKSGVAAGAPRVFSISAGAVNPATAVRANLCLVSRLMESSKTHCELLPSAISYRGGCAIPGALQVYARPLGAGHVVVTPDSVLQLELATGYVVYRLGLSPLCVYGGPEGSFPPLNSSKPRSEVANGADAYFRGKTGRTAPSWAAEALVLHWPALPSVVIGEDVGRITSASPQDEETGLAAFCTDRGFVLVFDTKEFRFVDFCQLGRPALGAFVAQSKKFVAEALKHRTHEVEESLKARRACLRENPALGELRSPDTEDNSDGSAGASISGRLLVIQLPRACVVASAMLPVLGPLLTIKPTTPGLSLAHVSVARGAIVTGWSDGSLLLTILRGYSKTIGVPTLPAACSPLSSRAGEGYGPSQPGTRPSGIKRLPVAKKGNSVLVSRLASSITGDVAEEKTRDGLALSDGLLASRREEHVDLVACTCTGPGLLFSADRGGRVLVWK